ncbi:MAG: malic enzyme-like NAD(P)-binding protein, partial [Desulfobacterales bacterium]
LYAALRVTNTNLGDQKILFLGAGEAGTGIGDLVVAAMMDEGLPAAEARRRCWFVDSKGLVVQGRGNLAAHKQPYAHNHEPVGNLLEAVAALRPTAIIGASGKPRTFTRPVLEAMAACNERPIVFALSNPTSNSECTAREAYEWTEGRALFASGSPFDPVELNGRQFVPSQGNNVYIFPGVGLGVVSCKASHVIDEMFLVAARTLADQVTEADLRQGSLYPSLQRIRKISAQIAMAVAALAYDQGLAAVARPIDMKAFIKSTMWEPVYVDYV